MKLHEYREWVIDHDAQWDYHNNLSFQNLLHYHLALCEEAGEAGGQAKKFVRELKFEGAVYTEKGDKVYAERRQKVGIEMVDVMIYFMKILEQWNISSADFDEFWNTKFKELHGRWDDEFADCPYGCLADD